MTPARKLEQEQEPKGYVQPAKIRDEHVALNPEAPEHWRKWIVIDDHPITKAYQRGQLASGRRDYTARDRWEAGLIFRSIYEAVNGSNIASSNLNRVTGASGFDRTSENIQSARDLLKKVLERLSADNSQIIMSVCGEGKWPSESVTRDLIEPSARSSAQP